MPTTAEITARMSAKQIGTQDYGGPEFRPTMEALLSLVDGVVANSVDLAYFDERTVALSSNDDIDLSGVLVPAIGSTAIAFAKIAALFLINRPKNPAASANLGVLTIGLGANPFLGFLGGTTPTLGPIQPGNFVLLAGGHLAGFGTVTAGTADILRIACSSAGAATYQIGILGRSA